MFTALIVDDEFAARETIKELVHWEQIGFAEPVCARSGKQALQLIQQSDFDVVFTDIQMPMMDGIELLREIRRIRPAQKAVIISCHERFDYAREAFKLGVEEYLIKDLITTEQLYSLLYGISCQPSAAVEISNQKDQETVDNILYKIIMQKDRSESDQTLWNHHMQQLKLAGVYAFSVIVDGLNDLRLMIGWAELQKRLNQVHEWLQNESIAVVQMEQGEFFALLPLWESTSMLQYIYKSVEAANRLKEAARNYGLTSISLGISNPSLQSADVLTLHKQASEASDMRVFYGLGKTILYNTIPRRENSTSRQRIESIIDQIHVLAKASDDRCLSLIQHLYSIDLMDGFMELYYYRYVNMRLLAMAIELIGDQKVQTIPYSLDEINNAQTVEEMIDVLQAIYMLVLEKEPVIQECEKHEDIALRAKQFIEEQIESELSLQIIADTLHVHKGYLCRAFKQKIGINLMQYVTSRKIERSKYLLKNTSLQLQEIATQLNYKSPQYFSMVFKRETNITPLEYKKSASK